MAVSGVVVGHGVAYAGGAAGGHPETPLHDLLENLLFVLAPFAALAVVLVVLGAGRAGRLGAGRLLTLETALFVALETAERAAAGAPVSGLVSDPAVWLGLAAQVALVAAALLTVRTATRALGGRTTPPAAVPRPAGTVATPSPSVPAASRSERPLARGPPPAPHPHVSRPRSPHAPVFPSPA